MIIYKPVSKKPRAVHSSFRILPSFCPNFKIECIYLIGRHSNAIVFYFYSIPFVDQFTLTLTG